jgi:formyltetrahydrofolate deformylase
VLGTVDAVTRYLFEQGCYVTEHHSFDDRLSGRFFIRVEFRQPDGFDEQASAPAWPSAAKPSAWSSS